MLGKAFGMGISRLGSSMRSLSLDTTANTIADTLPERVPRSRFSMVRRRALDVDDGGMDAGDHGEYFDDGPSPTHVAGRKTTGLSTNHTSKMRGKIVRKTKKTGSTDSPRSIPVVRPIYTYARIFKPKVWSAKGKSVNGWSTPKNPVRLADFSKSEASPLPGHTASILSTPQRENPDWLLFKSPEKTESKIRKGRMKKSKTVNDEPNASHKKPLNRKPKRRTPKGPSPSPPSSPSPSPLILRKVPRQEKPISSSDDSDKTEPVASFLGKSKQVGRRNLDRGSHQGRKLKLLQKESTRERPSRAESSASMSSTSATVTVGKGPVASSRRK